MANQRTDVDPEKAVAEDVDKKEDVMLMMTANAKWDQLFLPVPLSISLLGELLLVCADRDISLRDRCPEGGFMYLKYPDSLRACLVQITNSGWNAFNSAHTNMNQIRLQTANVETHIKYAVRILLGGTVEEIKEILPRPLSKVSEIAKSCEALAGDSENRFMEVLHLTEEALEACEAAKGHYKERDRKTEEAIRVARDQKRLSEESKKQLDEYYQKKERELIIAKEKFDAAVKEMPSASELTGAYMLEGIFDTFMNLGNPITAQLQMNMLETLLHGLINAKPPDQTVNVSIPDMNTITYHILGMKELFKGMRQNISEFEIDSALEIRQQLEKERVKIVDNSTDLYLALGGCIDQAIQVCSDFIDYAKRAERDDEEACKIEKMYNEIQNNARKMMAEYKKNHGYPIESSPERTQSRSLAGHIFDTAIMKVEKAKQNLADARQTHDETYEELRKENNTLRQTLVEMQRLDLVKIDFDEILETLQKGISALVEVKEKWGKLCGFFQMISNLIKCCLGSSFECFVDYSSGQNDLVLKGQKMSTLLKQIIIEKAKEANCVAYVVQSISSAYVDISSNHLMEGISSLGKLLPLDTKENLAEMMQKRAELHKDMENAQKAISAIMEKNKREFDERIAERVKRIETEVEAILQPLPEEHIKEIRDSLQEPFITDSAELDKAVEEHF